MSIIAMSSQNDGIRTALPFSSAENGGGVRSLLKIFEDITHPTYYAGGGGSGGQAAGPTTKCCATGTCDNITSYGGDGN